MVGQGQRVIPSISPYELGQVQGRHVVDSIFRVSSAGFGNIVSWDIIDRYSVLEQTGKYETLHLSVKVAWAIDTISSFVPLYFQSMLGGGEATNGSLTLTDSPALRQSLSE